MIKRLFDIISALLGLVLLSPLLLVIALAIGVKDGAPILFKQTRIGRQGDPFTLYKFRTMRPDSESSGQLSVGERDPRVTDIGHALRKTKLDELPQLWNVLKGDMSVVGPRPEVPRYVDLYSEKERKVLQVRPGITDAASLAYFNESEMMAEHPDPERYYIETIMKDKLQRNLDYLEKRTFWSDMGIIFKTISRIFQ
ncbi:MAG: sugar transferase [Flavobacteriales bacterium]|nr:sugar transferase [Flavobacteriales bacterium]